MNDRVIERIFIKADVELLSPCMVGSGEDNVSDMDVVRDHEGNPYIPGSSIAGVLRSYCANFSKEEDESHFVTELFGARYKDSTMSCIFVSDGIFKKINDIDVRDGVSLDQWKTAIDKSKYSYEVISSGAVFELKLEVVFRKKHEKDIRDLEHQLYTILKGLENGELSIGAKTRRGFGRIGLKKDSLKILKLDFASSQEKAFDQWLNFNWQTFTPNVLDYGIFKMPGCYEKQFTTIIASFNIPYSVIIRRYSADPEGSDYEHLKDGDKPVISGTSLAGAVRHHLEKILCSLGKSDRILDEIFGYVNDDEADFQTAKASKVYFDEVRIHGSNPLKQTRVKIDRFTGGAAPSALFTEMPEYLGSTTLSIRIPKNLEHAEAIIGLLILALKDMGKGLLPIGGETSIGRGILEQYDEEFIKIDEKLCSEEEEKKYLAALAKFLHEWDGGDFA